MEWWVPVGDRFCPHKKDTLQGMMSSSWAPILSAQERQTSGNDEFQLGTDSVHTRKADYREWWVPVGNRFCPHKKGRLQGMMSSSWATILSAQERQTSGNDEFRLGTDSVCTRKTHFRELWVPVGHRFCLPKKGRLQGMMSSSWALILSAQERQTSGNDEFQLGTDYVPTRKADFREWWVPVGHRFCLPKKGRFQGMMSSSWAPILSAQERQTSGNDEFQLGTDFVSTRKADFREWWVPVGHRFCPHKKGRLQGMMSSSWAPILSAQERQTSGNDEFQLGTDSVCTRNKYHTHISSWNSCELDHMVWKSSVTNPRERQPPFLTCYRIIAWSNDKQALNWKKITRTIQQGTIMNHFAVTEHMFQWALHNFHI